MIGSILHGRGYLPGNDIAADHVFNFVYKKI